MTSDEINLIGYMAAACTTVCWLPQAVRTVRTRDTTAISLWTQALFAFGIVLWLIYGLYIASIPIVLANGISLMLVLVILGMKIRYG